jgi:hypothetical protein
MWEEDGDELEIEMWRRKEMETEMGKGMSKR